MASVRLEYLCKNFGAVRAVDGVSLEIPDGELMVLVGPSGCGKSTLLRLVAGLEDATSGGIFLDDREVSRVKPQDRDVAMVFQNYALFPAPQRRAKHGVQFEVPQSGQAGDSLARRRGG